MKPFAPATSRAVLVLLVVVVSLSEVRALLRVIGADLLNLGRIRGLGAPRVSTGGAGTFDGIFVTGVLAALLA